MLRGAFADLSRGWAVSWSLKQANYETDFHMVVRALTDLHEFTYDPDSSENGQRQALRNFSSIDITFVAGEPWLLPWHAHVARLLAFLNQCIISGGRVCGDLVAARILWHLACTCGRQIQVVDVLDNADLPAAIPPQHLPKAYAGRTTVMLQEISGEAFQFTEALEDATDLREVQDAHTRDEHSLFAGVPFAPDTKPVKPKKAMLFRDGTFVQVSRRGRRPVCCIRDH
jgi:hypothetical protein